jgi:hypothetical protein
MTRLGKYLTFCLVVVLLVSSLLMIIPANAQNISRPSAPQFIVRWINNSYSMPQTSTTDPYFGNTVNNPTQSKLNYSIEVIITNQPTDETLKYNICVKGHYEGNWTSPIYSYEDAPTMSTQSTTSIIFTSTSNDGIYRTPDAWTTIYAPINGKIDFQVQAFVGYYTNNGDTTTPLGSSMYYTVKVRSDWSNTQTITIGESSSTNTPAPSPTVPEFPITATLIAVLAVVSLLLIVGKRKNVVS